MIIYPWISAVGTLSTIQLYTTYTSTPDTASVDQDQGNVGGWVGRGHGQCSADISGDGDGYL